MTVPALELADIFRIHGPAYLDTYGASLSAGQKKALRDIAACRTAALGGHVEECDRCGHRQIAYNSCRNRHCPKCQATAAAQWMEAREAELLPVEYFHVVFALLRHAFDQGKLSFHGKLRVLADAGAFQRRLTASAQTEWVVYAKPPFGGDRAGAEVP